MRPSSSQSSRRLTAAMPLGALFLMALAVRLYRLDWSLPYAYEEATPLHVAWNMWGWDRNQGINLNPQFFNYPSLTFYIQFVAQGLLYLVMKLGGRINEMMDWFVMYYTDPTPLYVTARLVNALFGAATAVVVYRSAVRFGGRIAAITAFALVATNPFHIARSQMVEVDVPLTFFAALALHASVGVASMRRRRDTIMAGVAAGLAASCKYTGALLLVPVFVAHLLRRDAPTRVHVGRFAISVALAVLAFVVTSPFVLLDGLEAAKDVGAERRHMALGHFGGDARATWLYYASVLFGDVVSIPAAVAAMCGIVLFAVLRRERSVVVLASFVVAYLIVVSTWAMKADRYLLPLIPALAVLAGAALAAASRTLNVSQLRVPSRLLSVTLVLVVLAPDIVRYAGNVGSFHDDPRTDAREWLDANVPGGSYVVTEAYGPEFLGPDFLMTMAPPLRRRVIDRLGAQRILAKQTLPMFQTDPERSAPFYSLELYENADYFIVSSGVASRYRREPDRFAPQIAFYHELERRMALVGEFKPSRAGEIRVTIYRRPHREPFAARASVAPPPTVAARQLDTGNAPARFYFEMGANFEFFQRMGEALISYQRALEAGMGDVDMFHNCVLGETRCLLAMGRNDEAIEFLRRIATHVTDDAERAAIQRMHDDLSKALRAK